jgi:hypothetical protein
MTSAHIHAHTRISHTHTHSLGQAFGDDGSLTTDQLSSQESFFFLNSHTPGLIFHHNMTEHTNFIDIVCGLHHFSKKLLETKAEFDSLPLDSYKQVLPDFVVPLHSDFPDSSFTVFTDLFFLNQDEVELEEHMFISVTEISLLTRVSMDDILFLLALAGISVNCMQWSKSEIITLPDFGISFRTLINWWQQENLTTLPEIHIILFGLILQFWIRFRWNLKILNENTPS